MWQKPKQNKRLQSKEDDKRARNIYEKNVNTCHALQSHSKELITTQIRGRIQILILQWQQPHNQSVTKHKID